MIGEPLKRRLTGAAVLQMVAHALRLGLGQGASHQLLERFERSTRHGRRCTWVHALDPAANRWRGPASKRAERPQPAPALPSKAASARATWRRKRNQSGG